MKLLSWLVKQLPQLYSEFLAPYEKETLLTPVEFCACICANVLPGASIVSFFVSKEPKFLLF
jgi:hypothetical protein